MIDTHTHLDLKDFDQDRRKIIKSALSNGVEKIINVGFDLTSSLKSIQLSEEFEQIYAAVGFHPHDAKDLNEKSLKEIEGLANHSKVVAIGEIGLDYYRNLSSREDQLKAFRDQIALAKNLNLPIVVHSREAHDQTLEILKDANAKEVGGVLHSFTGNADHAKMAQDMGFYFGFNGMLTYKESKTVQVARGLPIDSILIETDCPYLSPVPHRGERNQPAYVRYVLEKLTDLFSPLTFEDLVRITSLNAHQLFRLDKKSPAKIAYPIRNSLYLNITNRCSNSCSFCVRNYTDYVKGHNLRLDHEPSYQEIIGSLSHLEKYEEVVFCGYGEPTIRLDLLKEVARFLKSKNAKVRLNTNGQGNLIHKRNIVPELAGLIDTASISLNVDSSKKYDQLCSPEFGENTFEKVIDFAKECKRWLPKTVLTFLEMPGVNLKRCEKIAKELGVELRIRHYNKVG
ncbi:MAG: TatD family hydrolase [Candidatus Zixiibacteriota bacterium]